MNEVETLYELVLEGCFGGAVPDNDNPDPDSNSKPFELYSLPPRFQPMVLTTPPVKHHAFYHRKSGG